MKKGLLDAHAPVVKALLLFGVVGLLTLIVALSGDQGLARTLTEMLIRLIAVLALAIFVGNSGIISFGHVGFMAIGAYATAWLTLNPVLKPRMIPGLPDALMTYSAPGWAATLASGILAAFVALLVGAAILRLSGLAASIATFALLAIIHSTYGNWDAMTGGLRSLIGVPRWVGMWSALGWASLALVVTLVYQQSRFGLALRSSRDDHFAAISSGVDIARQRLFSFVLSAFVAGCAGSLLAFQLGSLSISLFWLDLSFILLVMLVVGGMDNAAGAIRGVLLISTAMEILRRFERGVDLPGYMVWLPEGAQQIGLGLLILIILIKKARRRGQIG